MVYAKYYLFIAFVWVEIWPICFCIIHLCIPLTFHWEDVSVRDVKSSYILHSLKLFQNVVIMWLLSQSAITVPHTCACSSTFSQVSLVMKYNYCSSLSKPWLNKRIALGRNETRAPLKWAEVCFNMHKSSFGINRKEFLHLLCFIMWWCFEDVLCRHAGINLSL